MAKVRSLDDTHLKHQESEFNCFSNSKRNNENSTYQQTCMVKILPAQDMKAYMGSRSIAPLILNLDTRCR